MAYLTLHNIYKLISLYDFKEFDDVDPIYEKEIYVFHEHEIKRLKAIREFLKNPDFLLTHSKKRISRIENEDLVFKSTNPAYHINSKCTRLKSDYLNFKIPKLIKSKGKDVENQFIEACEKRKKYLDKGLKKIFLNEINDEFNVDLSVNEILLENSGVLDFNEMTLNQLIKEIDRSVKEMGRYYYKNSTNTLILKKYGRMSFLAYSETRFYINELNFTSDQIQEFLKNYHEKFKLPLRKLLLEYYRKKYNNKLKFRDEFLEDIGFSLCSECRLNYIDNVDDLDDDYENILEDRYYQTYLLIGDAEGIEELAELRGLAISTIYKHLDIIKNEIGNESMQHFKPNNWLINEVNNAVEQIGDSSRLKPIYEYLDEEIDYNDIRLALLFID